MNRIRPNKIERVACYIRVSTQEQKLHGLSLDAQRMKLEEYAEKHNLKIVEWYVDEGVSGRKLIRKRPELQRMIQDAEKGKFDRIIFIKLDRFFRSVAEYHEAMKRITPVVWTATEETYDLSTSNGRMLVNMRLAIAEQEADTKSERIKIVNDYKTSTGQPLTGAMPLGFTILTDETTHRKKIIKDLEVAPIVYDAIDHFLTYQSVRKALIYIHTKHHISISYQSLTNLLKNTMLYGAYRDNLTYCEAYIDKETFDRIQELLKRNGKVNTRENRTYIFSGLVRCPNCNRVMRGGTYVHKKKSGKTYRYKYYSCHHAKTNNICTFKKHVLENTLQKKMLLNLESYLEDAKLHSFEVKDSTEPIVPKYDIEEINTQIDRLNYSWQTGKIRTVEQYEKQYDELLEKLRLAEEEKETYTVKDFSKIESILSSGWQEMYNALDDEHRQAFWKNFISSIELEWTDDIKHIAKVNFF